MMNLEQKARSITDNIFNELDGKYLPAVSAHIRECFPTIQITGEDSVVRIQEQFSEAVVEKLEGLVDQKTEESLSEAISIVQELRNLLHNIRNSDDNLSKQVVPTSRSIAFSDLQKVHSETGDMNAGMLRSDLAQIRIGVETTIASLYANDISDDPELRSFVEKQATSCGIHAYEMLASSIATQYDRDPHNRQHLEKLLIEIVNKERGEREAIDGLAATFVKNPDIVGLKSFLVLAALKNEKPIVSEQAAKALVKVYNADQNDITLENALLTIAHRPYAYYRFNDVDEITSTALAKAYLDAKEPENELRLRDKVFKLALLKSKNGNTQRHANAVTKNIALKAIKDKAIQRAESDSEEVKFLLSYDDKEYYFHRVVAASLIVDVAEKIPEIAEDLKEVALSHLLGLRSIRYGIEAQEVRQRIAKIGKRYSETAK